MNHSLLPAIRTATLPEKYSAAKAALQKCERIDECKEWADKSKALASYARQSQDKELEKMAMRIRARAIKRCGQLLDQVEKATNQHDASARAGTGRNRSATEAGLTKKQMVTALRVARVNGESFDEQVDGENPPTISALAEQGKVPAKGVPLYEKLGMTKKTFQAGMYFRGDIELYLAATNRHDPKDVADGSTPEERETITRNLELIDRYHKRLRAEL